MEPKRVTQRVDGTTIRHKSVAGAVQNAIVLSRQGKDTDYIADGDFRLEGIVAIKRYARQHNIRPETGWVDRPTVLIKDGIGYVDGSPVYPETFIPKGPKRPARKQFQPAR